MGNFKRVTMPLAKIKANHNNPRIISESKLKKLINSLLVFPKMLSLRPITIADGDFVLGGNMRQTALNRISQMKAADLREHIETLPEFINMSDDDKAATLKFWEKFLKKPQIEVQIASDLTEEEKQQFIIKDNVNYGDWDYDELENWDSAQLESWGLDAQMPDFNPQEMKQPTDLDMTENEIAEKSQSLFCKISFGSLNDLHDFINQYQDVIVNDLGGSIIVHGGAL